MHSRFRILKSRPCQRMSATLRGGCKGECKTHVQLSLTDGCMISSDIILESLKVTHEVYTVFGVSRRRSTIASSIACTERTAAGILTAGSHVSSRPRRLWEPKLGNDLQSQSQKPPGSILQEFTSDLYPRGPPKIQ